MLLSEEGNQMLKEMRESGELCCITISSDFHYVWDVAIARYSKDSHIFEKPFGSFTDLNEAIAKAYSVWQGTYPVANIQYMTGLHQN